MPISLALRSILTLALLTFAVTAMASTATTKVAPTPQFRRYDTADGLPDSSISAIAQDPQGFIWVAAGSGLARYDGTAFKVWRHRSRDPASLPSDRLRTLFVDAEGRLWGGGDDGLTRYDPASDGFLHWRHDPATADSIGSNQVSSLAHSADGSLWVGLNDRAGGLDRLRADGRGFEHLRHDPNDPTSLASNKVYALLAEPDGRLWIATGQGLDLRLADGKLRHVRIEYPSGTAPSKDIYSLAHADHTLMIGTPAGPYRLDPDGVMRPLAPQMLSTAAVLSIQQDQRGRLWIGTIDGLYLRDTDGRYHHFAASPLLPHALPGSIGIRMLCDREGGLWIATEKALAYLAPDWDQFTRNSHRPDDPASLGTDDITAVAAAADGRLWIGGQRGTLDRLDPTTQTVEHLDIRPPIAQRTILAMREDARGRLWLTTLGGVLVLDHNHLARLKSPDSSYHLVQDEQGTVYTDTDGGGISVIDPDTLQAHPLPWPHNSAEHASIDDLRWYAQALWVASDTGLIRWSPGQPAPQFVPNVAHQFIRAMDFHGDEIWLASADGLSVYRWQHDQAQLVANYPLSQRDSFDDVMGLRVDGDGRVWLFTRSGLWRYDPGDDSLRSFGLEHGLADNFFGNDDPARTADGYLYLPSKNAVVGFRPEAIHDRQRKPAVILDALNVRRGDALTSLPLDGKPVTLGWRDRDFTVAARALSFIAPQRNVYRFRLEGLDNDWVDTGTRSDRSFIQLGEGDYTLRVQAAGPDGIWGELATPLHLHVDAAPWLRWWAWLLYALLLALPFASLLLAMRRRQQRRHQLELLAQQHQLANAASQAKTRFLAELGHEIRTPMTGVLGMAELLLTRALPAAEHGYAQAIQRSGEVLLTLVNGALDLARIEAGQLQLAHAPLDPRALLQDVAALQAGKAAAKGLALHVAIDEQVPAQVLGDAVRIKQILLNLSGNALKFTERGEVRLSAAVRQDGLLFVVADTGPGIDPRDQAKLFHRYEQLEGPQRSSGSGLGLAICRELVTLMDGTITLDSAPGRGSAFQVALPLPSIETTASPAPVAVATVVHGSARQILLLEDDPVIAEVIVGLLQDQGHCVIHAANGLQALQRLDLQHFDVALVDLDLPGINGFQWARLAHRQVQAASLPLIAITARSDGDEEALAREAGMIGFLRKPLSGAQLARALDAALAQRPTAVAPAVAH